MLILYLCRSKELTDIDIDSFLGEFGAWQSDFSGQVIWNTIGQEPRQGLEVNMFLLRIQFQHAHFDICCIVLILSSNFHTPTTQTFAKRLLGIETSFWLVSWFTLMRQDFCSSKTIGPRRSSTNASVSYGPS